MMPTQNVCDVSPFLKLKMKGDFAILLLRPRQHVAASFCRKLALRPRTWMSLNKRLIRKDGRKTFSNREKVIFMARTISSQSLDACTALPSSVAYQPLRPSIVDKVLNTSAIDALMRI
jgi:hypothetical protein